jgi:hypothetical protein
MVRFECDCCSKIKAKHDDWILGFAAENIGVMAARREVTIADTWDDRAARDWMAIHFCSNDCRANYMGRIFAEVPPATRAGLNTVTRKRIQRVVAGAVVETVVAETQRPLVRRSIRRSPKLSSK